MAKHSNRSGRRGFAVIFFCTMWAFVLGCVGLAIDVGTIYMIKARLSAAVDAAALAAGRSVNLANTVQAATTNATTTATNFFNANFPSGYFNSIGAPTVTPNFNQETDGNGNPNGVLDIKVTASATAPTYFMNVFGVHTLNVAATGTATRRGLVMMLVLDTSSSMGSGAGSSCNVMSTAAANFVTLFGPFDQIGLVTFGLTATLLDAPTITHTTGSQLVNDINGIANNCGSNTNTTSALELAYEQIQNAGLPLALNSIVLFTDGSPNGVTATFPVFSAQDTRYGPALAAPPVWPAQPGGYNCNGGVGGNDANGDANELPCVMAPGCTTAGATIYGAISQTADQNSVGGTTYGLQNPTSGVLSAYAPNAPNNVSTGGCTGGYYGQGGNMRQFVAYIPDTDAYGNSLHGVAATGTSPYGTVANGKETRDGWLYQVNNECSPDPTVVPNCKNVGGLWSGFATTGSGSNFFSTGPSINHFRPDQPNSVVAASMNGAMSEALRIRSDTTYHPIINCLYLTGNGSDAIDHEFLPVIANSATVPPLPYDANGTATYANPAYVTTQETGKYLVTADKNQLATLFGQLASEVLRLSQ